MEQLQIVERAGISVRDMLVSSNPWDSMKCGRDKCFFVEVKRVESVNV